MGSHLLIPTDGGLRRGGRRVLPAFRCDLRTSFLIDPSRRSIVYLEIDNRQCIQSSSQCFQSATDVAAFLGALASLGNLNIPYKIEAVKSKQGWAAGGESAETSQSHPFRSLSAGSDATAEHSLVLKPCTLFLSPFQKMMHKKNCLFLLIPGLFQNHYHYKSFKKSTAQPAPINQ